MQMDLVPSAFFIFFESEVNQMIEIEHYVPECIKSAKHMIAEGRNIPAQPDTKQMKKDQVTRYIKDKGVVNSYDKKG